MRAIALVALLATTQAYADATATANITNRSPNLLTRADGSSTVIDGNSAILRPGDRLSYSFDYHLEASDDGRPVSDETRANFGGPFWSPLAISLGAEGFHGSITVNSFEVAMASIYPDALTRPWESLTGPFIVLATRSDEISEHKVLDGRGELSFALLAGWGVEEQLFTLPEMRIDTVALFEPKAQPQQVPAIPEPATWALMALGLGWLVLRTRPGLQAPPPPSAIRRATTTASGPSMMACCGSAAARPAA